MKRLHEIPLSKRSDVLNNVERAHIFHESRACVPPRRGKVNRRGKRIVRDGHGDVCKRRGHRGGHFESSYIEPVRAECGLGKKKTKMQRGRDSEQIPGRHADRLPPRPHAVVLKKPEAGI